MKASGNVKTHRWHAVLLLGVLVALTLILMAVPVRGSASSGPRPPEGLEYIEREGDLGLRVCLSWEHRDGLEGYRVYRSYSPSGEPVEAGSISSATMDIFPYFLDDGAEPGTTCYYRVAAIDTSWKEGPTGPALEVNVPAHYGTSSVNKKIICSIADQRVYCFENNQVVNILRCSTGAGGTPVGNFRIFSHRRYVYGGTYVCEYWMDWKPNYGIHSWPRYRDGYRDYEESLGVRPRSAGCIRLHPFEAYWPYYWAPLGTPLSVISGSLGRLPLQGGSSSGGVSSLSESWYFAEGYTGPEFREYLVFFNPGDTPVNALTTYFPENYPAVTENYHLAPRSRYTVYVNGVSGLPPSSHAIRVEADGPITVQQSEYFEYGGRRGGHTTPGVQEPSENWFFAEGYTGGAFDTYLLLFNPGADATPVTVTFMREAEHPVEMELEIPGLTRGTILVNAVPGMEMRSASMEVESALPLVAQRAVYFAIGRLPNGVNGGTSSTGVARPSKTWYLAEGSTGSMFDHYLVFTNPGDQVADIDVIFFPATGPYGHYFQLAPRTRGTLKVNAIPGLADAETPSVVNSNQEIVVERVMYYYRDSRRGGHASTGIPEPSQKWYLAEGYTGGSFEEFILILNPGDEPATAHMTFYREDGQQVAYSCVIPPHRRVTVTVALIPGLEWTGSAVELSSDRPVVVEQSHYFCIPR